MTRKAVIMSKKDDRIERLIKILRLRGYVSIKELSRLLNVSEMTVRRDLRILEANKIAENIDGTTVYNPAHLGIGSQTSYNLSSEADKQNRQKDRIGKYAAGMVAPNDIIVIDTGSTTERLASYLPTGQDITVLCYNVNILMEIRRIPGIKIIFSGGYYHPNTQMFSSEEGIQFIKGIRAQKVFVSAAGIHTQLGVTCANGYEVPTKKAILGSSIQKILVADSSKFGKVRSAYFCNLDEIDDVVTDDGLSEEWRKTLTDMGIRLHIVAVDESYGIV